MSTAKLLMENTSPQRFVQKVRGSFDGMVEVLGGFSFSQRLRFLCTFLRGVTRGRTHL